MIQGRNTSNISPLTGSGAFILRKGGIVYIKRGRFFFIIDEFYERYDSIWQGNGKRKRPVTIAAELEKDICKNAQDILKLVFHGHEYLVFFDIRKIYRELIAEL